MILTITLNPAMDLGMVVEDWVLDDVNRASRVTKSPGGKGINVSRVLKELGDPTTALTVLGSDSVQEFRRLAREEGVTIVYISIPGEIRTNIHIMDPKNDRLLKVNQPGSPLQSGHFDHFMLLLKQQLKMARMLSVGGSLPPGLPIDAYGRIVHLARKHDVPVLIDAEGEALLAALAEGPYIVKPNRRELEVTMGGKLNSPKEILEAAREIQGRGAQGVVVTNGPHPTVGVLGKEAWQAKPPRVRVVGTNGAGDSFTAGLVSGLTRGLKIQDALALGTACGAASCKTEETELARRKDVEALLPKVNVQML